MRKDFFRTGIVLSMIILFLGAGVLPSVSEDVVKLSWLSDNEYDFLIISPSEFTESLEPLVSHKNSYDVQTKTVSLDEIYDGIFFPVNGRDNPEKIKYFIKNAVEHWNISYVMLVGNRTKMPVRYSNPTSSFSKGGMDEKFITDLYYADIYNTTHCFCSWDSNNNGIYGEFTEEEIIDDVDLYPDVNIGRILCSSSTEVDVIINKIITYENNTYNQPWVNNIIICGGNTHPLWDDLGYIYKFNLRGEVKPASEGEYLGNRIAENMSGYNITKLYASAIFPFGDKDAKTLTIENMYNAINNGALFMLFTGHGNPQGIVTYPPLFNTWPLPIKFSQMPAPSGFTSPNIQNLTNENKLPILILNTCSGADFSNIDRYLLNFHLVEKGCDSPIAWEFTKYQDRGVIATYANTAISSNGLGTAVIKTLNGYMTKNLFKAYLDGYDKAGDLLTESINDYLNSLDIRLRYFPNYYSHIHCIEWWTFFGDPTLKIGGYP